MGLDVFPALSLADARGVRAVANGIDPQIQAEAAEEGQQIALDSIFSTGAAKWFKLKLKLKLKSKSVTLDCAKRYWELIGEKCISCHL